MLRESVPSTWFGTGKSWLTDFADLEVRYAELLLFCRHLPLAYDVLLFDTLLAALLSSTFLAPVAPALSVNQESSSEFSRGWVRLPIGIRAAQ